MLILGGGLGALTAAFELTRTEAARRRFHVTLLQHGWRLGGKAASGRAGAEARIQEHGLHLLMGFYDNAFQVMRACYGELRPDPAERFQHWDDAFKAEYSVWLGAPGSAEGANRIRLPKLPGTPGDPRSPLAPQDLVTEWLGAQSSLMQIALPPGLAALNPLFAQLVQDVRNALQTSVGQLLVAALQAIYGAFQNAVGLVMMLPGIPLWVERLVRIAVAFTRGLIFDVIAGNGFDGIDSLDFRAWLANNGATAADLSGGLVSGLYDLAFAYKDGDRAKPLVEAGTMAETFIRMAATYRDAPLWRMESGMGDVVVAPMYRVLRARGVDIRLFHRVTDVKLDASAKRVGEVTVSRQVYVAQSAPGGVYEPLKDYQGILGWPHEPFWGQIENGAALQAQGLDLESEACTQEVERTTWKVDDHFDAVVNGLSVGAFPTVCADLIAKLPAWSQMVASLPTVRTQVMQLWFDRPASALGPLPDLAMLSGGTPPFDSWGDMSHVLPAEDWSGAAVPPQTVGYLCGVMDETAVGAPAALAAVSAAARAWLDSSGVALWPNAATNAGTFDDARLVKPAGANAAVPPLDTQFLRANIDPTERYVLSLPGSSAHRLAAGGSGVENLFLAGDWVRTSINGGSSESAFEAGVEGARALLRHYGAWDGLPV